MHVEEVPNRPMMVRAVARRRPQARNNDLAIVTISPLPGNPLHFPTVDEIIREFFQHRRTRITDLQPCHLGQAFVRFEFEHDRDRFVLESPTLMIMCSLILNATIKVEIGGGFSLIRNVG
jgi:hypothetical protein